LPNMMEGGNNASRNNSSRFTSLNDFIKNTYGSTVSTVDSGSQSQTNQTDAISLINNDDPSATSGATTDYNSEDDKNEKWSLRRIALELSLWANIFITITKLIAYIQTMSLSVLAALLDSVLDVISQFGQYRVSIKDAIYWQHH
jgi:hypothetical protein